MVVDTAATVTSVLVRVFPKIFSRVSLLLRYDTILKAINMKSRFTWKKNREKNHDVYSFIVFLMNTIVQMRELK